MAKHDKKNKQEQAFVVWQGYEYEHREKTGDWYWVLTIISVAVAVGAIFFHNYLFAVLIIVAAFSIAVHAAQKPALKEFRIDARGIKIGKKFYRYESIDSFWIDDGTVPPQLFFELKRPFIPLIIIPVGTANVAIAKEILFNNLTEKEQSVPAAQKILDSFGF